MVVYLGGGSVYFPVQVDSCLGICILRDGNVVFANKTLLKRVGYSFDELVDMGLQGIIYPSDRGLFRETFERLCGGEEGIFVPVRVLRKDDGFIWMALTLNVVAFHGVPSILVNFVDMETLRSVKEDADNELFELQKAIFEAIPHAVVGLENRKIIFANRAVYDIFGWKPEELVGRSMRLLFHSDEEYEEEGKRFYSVLRKKRTHRIEFTYRRKDGEDVTCLTSVSRIGDDPNSMRIVATHTNITEMKKIQRECDMLHDQLCVYTDHLHDMLERERAMIAREMHDKIGQSLTILKMTLFRLKKNLPFENEDVMKEFESTLGMVDEIINSMRDLASYLRPTLLDDLGLTAAMEWLIEKFQHATGIEVEFTFHPVFKHLELDRKIAANVYRILQEALTNVARHANASKVWVELDYRRGSALLFVRDDGCGIKPEDASNLRSFGIIGMKERATFLGGRLWVRRWRNRNGKIKGTLVGARIPVERLKNEKDKGTDSR